MEPSGHAVRSTKLLICKMLHRAGADVNQINELGVAPPWLPG